MKHDAAADADADAGICAPATSFGDGGAPFWTPPSTPSNVCTSQDLTDYDQACLQTSATQTTCDDWTSAHPTCFACLVTKPDAPALGPFIAYGLVYYANIGGCIALISGDSSATSCGAKEREAEECEVDVCTQCLAEDYVSFEDCTYTADQQQPCAAYLSALCATPGAGAVHDVCYSEKTFDDYVTKLGALFCSNGSADASTD